MSANRVQYFIRNVLQNSNLNREKFVKNKKIYKENILKNKNYNLFIKRNYSNSSLNFPNHNHNHNNNNNNNNHNNFIIMGLTALSAYIVTYKFPKK